MKREEKIAAESKGQRAKESIQCSKFKVHNLQSFLPLTSCPSGRRVVIGSENTSLNSGLQPHSIWLKPVFDCNYLVRQLKLTAKDSAAKSNKGALFFAVEFIQRIKEDTKREENNEYRISKWSKQPGFLFLFCFLFVDEDNRIHHLRPTGSSGRAVYNIAQSITSCQLPVASRHQLLKEISTVFHIKKPSAIGTYFPAEGCISESRAVRACLMIRVFNN